MPATDTKDCHRQQQLEESLQDSTQSLRGRDALPTPRFQTSGLQNHKIINFCCFKPLGLFYFCYSSLRQLIQGLLNTPVLRGRLLSTGDHESAGLREADHLSGTTQPTSLSRAGTWAVCYSSDCLVLFPVCLKIPYL